MSLSDIYFSQWLAPKVGVPLPGIPDSYSAAFRIRLEDIAETWEIEIDRGRLARVDKEPGETAGGLCYGLDESVFLSLVTGSLQTTEAFFRRQIQIRGGLFHGLKTGEMLARVFAAWPWRPPTSPPLAPAAPDRPAMPAGTFEETLNIDVAPGIAVVSTLACPENRPPRALCAIFPPDPTLGGGRDNNVIRALHARAAAAGMLSVVFGYRGTNPEGIAGTGALDDWDRLRRTGQMAVIADDCRAVFAAVRRSFGIPALPTCHAGYSFGGYVAMSLLGGNPCRYCAVISPPLGDYPFGQLPTAAVPVVFFHGTDDPFCREDDLWSLAQKWNGAMVCTGADDHFHRGQESALASAVVGRFEKILDNDFTSA